jgi:methylenetetrahydrofolate--tRNA-(uracil-5-)-methyltransferase
MDNVTIVGGGLAGCEAAWFLLNKNIPVTMYEMRPEKNTPAHSTGYLSELVCSNSLKAEGLNNSAGLLKTEMEMLNSLIIRSAKENRVPAGGALAVDRDLFARYITEKLQGFENFKLIRKEITSIPEERPLIISTGPLTSNKLANAMKSYVGSDDLYFYDAAAPVISYDSLNLEKVFRATRYNKGDSDYLNCPMNKLEYELFWSNLVKGEVYPLKEFEEKKLFEGCMPIEDMAKRGIDTIRFGPLKPVGLIDPRTGEQPYAVVQLRQDDINGTMFNLVGFQTNLKWPEQKRILSLIPGLEKVEILRYGVMHRNTYINSPKVLKGTFQLKNHEGIFFAGQITGVEGYIESAASGIVAGINCYRLLRGKDTIVFPEGTAIGALSRYITSMGTKEFQPMHINFGLLPDPGIKVRGRKEKREHQSKKAVEIMDDFVKTILLQN